MKKIVAKYGSYLVGIFIVIFLFVPSLIGVFQLYTVSNYKILLVYQIISSWVFGLAILLLIFLRIFRKSSFDADYIYRNTILESKWLRPIIIAVIISFTFLTVFYINVSFLKNLSKEPIVYEGSCLTNPQRADFLRSPSNIWLVDRGYYPVEISKSEHNVLLSDGEAYQNTTIDKFVKPCRTQVRITYIEDFFLDNGQVLKIELPDY